MVDWEVMEDCRAGTIGMMLKLVHADTLSVSENNRLVA